MSSEPAPPPGISRPALRTIINPVTHEVATFKRYSAETNHQFSEIDVTVRTGGGVPLHYHAARTEIFTAVSSVLHLQMGSQTVVLQPGETFTVPSGNNHRFWNPDGEDMTFTVRIEDATNGNVEDFEKGLYIWYGLAKDGKVKEDGIASNPLHVAVIMFMQDTWIAGWGFWLMHPALALLYAVARWTGVEKELVEKYWTNAKGIDVGEETPLLNHE